MIAAAPWSSAAAAAATSSAAPSTPSAREPRSPARPHRKKSPPSWAPEVGEMKSWAALGFHSSWNCYAKRRRNPLLSLRRKDTGGSEWPGSMARVRQPQVTAMATITGVGRCKGVLARVTAMASITAPLSSRTAAADRSLEAPAPGHRDGTTRSPASYPTWAMERQSSVVWCRPAGARKSRGRMLLSDRESAPPTYDLSTDSGLGRTEGDNAPLSMLPASRLTRHACSRNGPERMFTGTAAMKHWKMKHWKTSSAMYEPR